MNTLLPAFPSDIIAFDVPSQPQIDQHLHANDLPSVTVSNHYGYQSPKHPIPLPFDLINEILDQYLDCPVVHEDGWININQHNAFNERHTHPGSDLSAIYYHVVPPNSGHLVLTNPHHHTHFNVLSHTKNNNGPALHITPKANQIIIFPSYIEHKVEPNNSTEDRISIAWNIKLNPIQPSP